MTRGGKATSPRRQITPVPDITSELRFNISTSPEYRIRAGNRETKIPVQVALFTDGHCSRVRWPKGNRASCSNVNPIKQSDYRISYMESPSDIGTKPTTDNPYESPLIITDHVCICTVSLRSKTQYDFKQHNG